VQDDSGIRRVLASGGIYDAVQAIAGANRARRWLAERYWRVSARMNIVDIGCGTGDVLEYLPATVRYAGFDVSDEYIAHARSRYGGRGAFFVGTAGDFLIARPNEMTSADLVLCNGLLHHLDDAESQEVLTLAKRILAPDGRLVCFEPTFVANHPRVSRWLMSQDRGKNVRTDAEWRVLAESVFENVQTEIVVGLYRIPYMHIVIECSPGTRSV